jgi:UDP-GlcNAc:undecaprenyl-phosphate GlcNAc-1-phosphate transferase
MSQPFSLILFPLLSLIAVLAIIPLARKAALRIGHIDCPGGRKDHARPTPPVGGLVIIPVFILVSILSGADAARQWPFWAGLLLIMVAGTLDDRFQIRPRWKFLAQFVAAVLIVVAGNARAVSLGDLFGFGTVWLGFMHIPFSIIAAILLINAINLIDGLDGLAGGNSFAALLWMLVGCLAAGAAAPALSITIMMAALLGFLVFNMRNPFRRKATIFLGDAGSMSLGLTLAWFGMGLGRGSHPVLEPIAVAWILALPIMDTCAQFARRVAQGRHPFSADRNHFHHHFVNAGVSVGRATAIITLIGFILGMIGVGGMLLGVPEPVLAYSWMIVLFIHIYMSLRPHRFRRIVFSCMNRKPISRP